MTHPHIKFQQNPTIRGSDLLMVEEIVPPALLWHFCSGTVLRVGCRTDLCLR